ncbi:hypothetical protein [Chlorogloeopsis fritschii]|jgi:hypothetical protein|uniref:hypothetical protein n=1 Tax=Chlorogloeopsis fritschii TaxID=1124 RepID=UPI0023F18CA6|nr:hypothetical protein [Chlorogloeopsis fritschii]
MTTTLSQAKWREVRHQLYSDLKFVKKVLPTKKYLEKLLVRGCNWVSNYLWYNRNIE